MLRQLHRLAFVSLVALLATSCGGGGGDDVASGGIGGTGISSGSISSFGSIFVNGFEFDLTGVSITIDDQPGTEADLQLGQVVTVTTNIGGDGSVTVTKVDFDYNLEGPISATPPPNSDPDGLTKTFTVLGTTVIVDIDDTVFATGYAFADISPNDFVQISGFFDSNNVLHAKYITKTNSAGVDVEAKGQITELNTQTFKLRGLTVTYATADLSGVPGGLQDGLFVEVKGTLVAPANVSASKIELEGPAQNAVAAAVQGIITSFNNNGDFVVDSGNGPVHVDASTAVFDPPGLVLGSDLEIEAEGTLVNGTLIATKVDLRSALIKLETKAADPPVVGNEVELRFELKMGAEIKTVPVTVDGKTQYQDQRDHLRTFGLSDINQGDFLRVKARQNSSGLVATRIQRTNPRDVVLQGHVEAFTSSGVNTGTITILGLTFDTINGTTEFRDVDNQPLMGNFYTQVNPGDLLHIKDKDNSALPPDDGVGNGVADVVEFEN